MKIRIVVCLGVLGGVALFPARVPQAQAPADLVLTNGTILTVDARDSVAQALAVAGADLFEIRTVG